MNIVKERQSKNSGKNRYLNGLKDKKMKKYLLIVFLFANILGGYAQHATILVAPRDSASYTFAQTRSVDPSIHSFSSFQKALNMASQLLNSSADSVAIWVSAGIYDGKAGRGIWNIPKIERPNGKLVILGGWTAEFRQWNPLLTPSILQTSPGRADAFVGIEKNSHLQLLAITGLMMDAQISNRYDRSTNSLLKSGSRSYPMLRFSYLTVETLYIANNIFINAAQGVFDPMVYPANGKSEVIIFNNYFINNVSCIQQLGGLSRRNNALRKIVVQQNTFLSNWPFNPDATSSTVSAINLYHKSGADSLLIRKNIFAYNPGGALQHDWPEERMGKIAIQNNLFYQNAGLFNKASEDGVIVGKFGLNPRYLILDMETLEEDFDYGVSGNIHADPGIPILQEFSYNMESSEYWAKLHVKHYAPPMSYDPANPPLPLSEYARFGVQVRPYTRN